MKLVIQRVTRASVSIEETRVENISKGLVVLLGIEKGDDSPDVDYLVEKMVNLRIFSDENGKMNLSLMDVRGEILLVSQFTLAGDCRKGKRPSFDKAMPPGEAEPLYNQFKEILTRQNIPVREGRFGAMMQVELVNDGPVTFILESKK